MLIIFSFLVKMVTEECLHCENTQSCTVWVHIKMLKKFNENSCTKNNCYKNVNCFVVNTYKHLWSNACSGIGSHCWNTCEVGLQLNFILWGCLCPILSWLIFAHETILVTTEIGWNCVLGLPISRISGLLRFMFYSVPLAKCHLLMLLNLAKFLFPYQWDGNNNSNCLTELLGSLSKIVCMKSSTRYLELRKCSVNINYYCFHCVYVLTCFQDYDLLCFCDMDRK